MAAQRIAENLAFINWTLLTALGVGAFGAVVLMRSRTSATRGFLGFSAACAAGFGLLAHLSDGALVQAAAAPGSTVAIDPAWTTPRDDALIAFAILALVYAFVLGRPIAPLVAVGGLVAGIGAIAAGAMAWGGGPLGTIVAFGQDLLLAAATGGVFVAMILGHWYLVQPGLERGPVKDLVRWSAIVWPFEIAVFLWPTGMVQVLNGVISDGYHGILGWIWATCAVATIALVGLTWLALKEPRRPPARPHCPRAPGRAEG